MSDAIERLAEAGEEARSFGVDPDDCAYRAAEAILSALHLSPDAAAGLADGSWVAVPREPSEAMIGAMNGVWQDWPDLTVARAPACRWAALMCAVAVSQQTGEK